MTQVSKKILPFFNKYCGKWSTVVQQWFSMVIHGASSTYDFSVFNKLSNLPYIHILFLNKNIYGSDGSAKTLSTYKEHKLFDTKKIQALYVGVSAKKSEPSEPFEKILKHYGELSQALVVRPVIHGCTRV